MMTRQRLTWVAALAVVAVLLVQAGIIVHFVVTAQNSARPSVDRRVILDALPVGVDHLAGELWQKRYLDAHPDPAGMVLDYQQPESDELLQFRVSESNAPYRARIRFWWEDPETRIDAHDAAYVRRVDADGLHADQASVICRSIQKSTTDEYEQCGEWIYWARYGQYLLYIDAFQDAMNRSDFMRIVTTADQNMDRVLG